MALSTTLTRHIGQTIVLTVSVTEDGANKSLTDALAISFSLDTPNPVSKSLGSGIVVGDAPNDHQATIVIPAADTSGQAAGRYSWNLWVTDANGYEAPVAVGYVDLRSVFYTQVMASYQFGTWQNPLILGGTGGWYMWKTDTDLPYIKIGAAPSSDLDGYPMTVGTTS